MSFDEVIETLEAAQERMSDLESENQDLEELVDALQRHIEQLENEFLQYTGKRFSQMTVADALELERFAIQNAWWYSEGGAP